MIFRNDVAIFTNLSPGLLGSGTACLARSELNQVTFCKGHKPLSSRGIQLDNVKLVAYTFICAILSHLTSLQMLQSTHFFDRP